MKRKLTQSTIDRWIWRPGADQASFGEERAQSA